MNLKWSLILILLVLLVACSKTQTVGLNQPVQTNSEEQVQNTQPSQSVQTAVTNDSQIIQQETTESANIQNNQGNTQTTQDDSFNPANEYMITSCCNEGRLYAQTKKIRSSYTQENVKNILLEIYYSNCDNFKNIRELIYLRYSDEKQDTAYLQNYKNSSYKRILMDGNLITDSFSTCN